MKWNLEAERIHARWAMLGVAGILGAEIVRPDVFWCVARGAIGRRGRSRC
jgi:hypothetical protein